MKYFSMFSGIGGFELGIQQACEKLHNENGRRGFYKQCVGYSEIDKYAIQIYEKHFNHKNYGDATTIKPNKLPNHDLLVGGFPCQAFSIAGKRGGFKDTRGTLFFEIARVLKVKRPKNFVLENVKGLLSHDSGNTFATIIGALDELGYDCQWSVLNSKNFGVPQNRERVFIVGHLRGTGRPKIFPIGESSKGNFKYSAGVISARGKWIKDGKNLSREFSQGQRIYDSKGVSQTLAGSAGGQGGKTGLYAIPVLTPDRSKKRQHGRRFKEDGDPSFTLTGQDKHGVMIRDLTDKKSKTFPTIRSGGDGGVPSQRLLENAKIRRLTPTECERLQGFPNGWTEGVSDTQRYKTLGNAVTVPVVKAIIQKLI